MAAYAKPYPVQLPPLATSFQNHHRSTFLIRAASKSAILVTEKLEDRGLQILREFGEVITSYDLSPLELKNMISEFDAVVVRSGTRVTRQVLEAGKGRIRVVGRAGVGVDNVDLQAATELGCLVVNAPTANIVAAAEHSIAMLAAMVRNIAQADRSVKAGKWQRNKFVGVSLIGKTLSILGLGEVGIEVAKRAKGLGIHVIAYDPHAPTEHASALGVDLVTFDQAISTADFISLHMPLTPTTTHKIFDHETFTKVKKGVRIINVTRGDIIDEDALLKALQSGIVAQAALDVFEEEPPPKDNKLIQHENVTVTPHLGASTKEAQEGVAIEIAEAVVEALEGTLSATAINAPMLPPKVLETLSSYIDLAEKLGKSAVQLMNERGDGIKFVKVVYETGEGHVALDTRLLRAMIIKGIIEPITDSIVNRVNADFIAKQKGVRITEEREFCSSQNPINSIQIKLSNVRPRFVCAALGYEEISIVGKVKDGIPHLTQIGSLSVDASLEGNVILCCQVDRPGIIGRIGGILGMNNVNVNFMSVGRKVGRRKAIMAIGVDEEPDEETLKKIGEINAIEEFVFLKL